LGEGATRRGSSVSCPLKTGSVGRGGDTSPGYGGAGAGFYGDGADDLPLGRGGAAWAAGLTGGRAATHSACPEATGGFGGGGAGNGCVGEGPAAFDGGGGGGGWSGGDGGWVAGGGGSYNAGVAQHGAADHNAGPGRVTIDRLR